MILKIPVIYGSVRSGRQGIKAARFVERQLRGRGHEVTLVDPAELQLPLLERMFKEYPPATAPALLERLATLSIPSTFPVPKIGSAFTDDGSAMDPVFEKRFVRFATELEWYAGALKERRKGGVPY
jgi:NADPH-dependent FMN reductase